jgi:putative membrane protein
MPPSTELFLPWQFSPAVLTAVLAAAALYAHGARRTTPPPAVGRRITFYAGLLLLYSALQTSWQYYASHMFFVLQLQHFALHDLGPALLVAVAPGAALARGWPRAARRPAQGMLRALRGALPFLHNPCAAVVTYVGSLLIWLWPPLDFYTMVSNRLYELMSWTVLLAALPFWSLILDPRPYPIARTRPGCRIVMLHFAMLPIVLTGVSLSLAERDWYPVYAVCGRFLPIPPVADQQLGGIVMWILGGALFAAVFFVVLGRNLAQEEAAAAAAAR